MENERKKKHPFKKKRRRRVETPRRCLKPHPFDAFLDTGAQPAVSDPLLSPPPPDLDSIQCVPPKKRRKPMNQVNFSENCYNDLSENVYIVTIFSYPPFF